MSKIALIALAASAFLSGHAAAVPASSSWVSIVDGLTGQPLKRSDDGTSEGTICFDRVGSKCQVLAFVKYDEFRRLFHVTPYHSKMSAFGGSPALRFYLALPDCQAPKLLINAVYKGRAWLFVSSVEALSTDGKKLRIAFERESVERYPEGNGVAESATSVLTTDEIAQLRELSTTDRLIVRINGERGYATVPQSGTLNFSPSNEAATVLGMMDRLNSILKAKAASPCNR